MPCVAAVVRCRYRCRCPYRCRCRFAAAVVRCRGAVAAAVGRCTIPPKNIDIINKNWYKMFANIVRRGHLTITSAYCHNVLLSISQHPRGFDVFGARPKQPAHTKSACSSARPKQPRIRNSLPMHGAEPKLNRQLLRYHCSKPPRQRLEGRGASAWRAQAAAPASGFSLSRPRRQRLERGANLR